MSRNNEGRRFFIPPTKKESPLVIGFSILLFAAIATVIWLVTGV